MSVKKSEIEESAERLSRLSPYSRFGYIEPPNELIDDHKDYDLAHTSAIQPQWNHLVEILNDHSGYSGLLSMLLRLQEKRDNAQKAHDQTEKLLNRFKMAYSLFHSEAITHGSDETIRNSLGAENPQSSKPEWWTWSVGLLGTSWKGEQAKVSYKYSPKVADDFKMIFEADGIPDFVLPVDGEDTWSVLLNKTDGRGKLHGKRLSEIFGYLDLLRFRLELIEGVLHDYEVLGVVSDYVPREHPKPDEDHFLDDELRTFILTGIELFDKNPASFPTRKHLLVEVLDALGWTETDERSMRLRLEKANLYNKKERRGRPTRLSETPFLEEMIEIWKAFLEKGFKE